MNEKFLKDLAAKGYVQAPDGSWHKPKRGDLGGLGVPERKPDPIQALDGGNAPRQSRKASVGIRVEIVSFRKRLLDSDNHIAGNKPLRDSIAKSLGLDDGYPLLRWDYQQVRTTGQPGTLVKISV